MGYYITLEDADFFIPETPEVLQVLKDLNTNTPDNLKRGGSYTAGQRVAAWFSWMPENYHETVTSAREVFQLLGFECDNVGDGFFLLHYDSKAGQEDVFLNAVAPYVRDGSYLEWRGEDGAFWRQAVKDKRLYDLQPTWSWE